MKLINWNVSYAGSFEKKFEYLRKIIEDQDVIVIMQEITETAYLKLKEMFGDYKIEYSLNYRKPSKFDTKSRRLGVAIMVSNSIEVVNATVLDRCLLPDRTMFVEILKDNMLYKVLGLHSITGCDHKKAKSIQFFSFAEAIEEYKPDIVAIDANEPKYDSNDIEKMVFFDNKDKGKGAKTFFTTLVENDLMDSLGKENLNNDLNQEEPLKVSHVINKRINKRYDFVFLNKDKFKDYKIKYNYEDALEAGSDHALIEIEV